jgi:hypothetical protein
LRTFSWLWDRLPGKNKRTEDNAAVGKCKEESPANVAL